MQNLADFLNAGSYGFRSFHTDAVSLTRPAKYEPARLTLSCHAILDLPEEDPDDPEIEEQTFTFVLAFDGIRYTDMNFVDHGFFQGYGKGPQPLVLATRTLLETAGIPHKLLQAADLDPFKDPSPETENAKLFKVGGWLIFADNAIISFPNGMPNFA